MRSESGFSLIELSIVVAIAAVLAAVALPNMLAQSTKAKLRGAVSNLRGDLQTAKLMAIRENASIVFTMLADRYEVFVDNGAGSHTGNWARDADERLLVSRRIEAGVSIDLAGTSLKNAAATNSNKYITRFDDRGLPENFGTILLNSKSGQRKIILNRLGRVIIP